MRDCAWFYPLATFLILLTCPLLIMPTTLLYV